MKASIIIIKLLFLAALLIVSNNELYLKDAGDREVFFNHYYSWLEKLFDQGMGVTSYVVKSEWLPKDESIFLNPPK